MPKNSSICSSVSIEHRLVTDGRTDTDMGPRDFCQPNYLNIFQTDLHEICRIGRTLGVTERSEFIFSISEGTLPWNQFCVTKSQIDLHSNLVLRMTFARAAPLAYDKKGNCYAGRRQTNYLIRWTQANQLTS